MTVVELYPSTCTFIHSYMYLLAYEIKRLNLKKQSCIYHFACVIGCTSTSIHPCIKWSPGPCVLACLLCVCVCVCVVGGDCAGEEAESEDGRAGCATEEGEWAPEGATTFPVGRQEAISTLTHWLYQLVERERHYKIGNTVRICMHVKESFTVWLLAHHI